MSKVLTAVTAALLAVSAMAIGDEPTKFLHVDQLELENIELKLGNLQRAATDLGSKRAEIMKRYGYRLSDKGEFVKDAPAAPAKKEAKK